MIQKLGKYSIVEKLGEGAMGAVYKAYDEILGRYVAIKTMAEDIKWDPELKLRFYREARSAAGLHHPNIVTIHDLGEDGKITYIVMELLEGRDLKETIRDKEPIAIEKKLWIMVQVCEGLSHAHANGIIHRDIKPGNIHVTPSGNVKILDFGIARIPSSDLTRSGVRLGTPVYMSPEQIRGGQYDERSDIFSTGIVFYEFLTYVHPFRDKNIVKTMDNILFQTQFPFAEQCPDAPGGLWPILNNCLAKEPAARYASMAEVARACRKLAEEVNASIQRMRLELEQVYPRLREAAVPGAPPQLQSLAQRIRDLLGRDERPSYVTLKDLTAEIANEPLLRTAQQAPASVMQEAARPAPPRPAPPPVQAPAPPAAKPEAPPIQAATDPRGLEHLRTGRRLLEENRPDEALEAFRQALGILGPKEDVVQLLAQARKTIEERKQARIAGLLQDARAALSAHEYARAIEAVDDVLQVEPDRTDAVEIRRQALAGVEAEKERAARKEEGDREKIAGFRFLAEKKFHESARALRRARELLGEDTAIRLGIQEAEEAIRAEELRTRVQAEMAEAAQLFGSNALEEAKIRVRRALELAPKNGEAQDLLARIDAALEQKRRHAEAAQLLVQSREALARKSFEEATLLASRALNVSPEIDAQARAILEHITQQKESSRREEEVGLLLQKAEDALHRQKFDEAQLCAREALLVIPGHGAATAFLTRIDKAREEQRRQAEVAAVLGEAQQAFLRGDLQRSEAQARRVLELDQGQAKARDLIQRIEAAYAKARKERVAALVGDARQALSRGDFPAASARAREALQLEPQDAEAQSCLAAIAQAEESKKRQEIEALLSAGRAALAQRSMEEAAKLAQNVIELEPGNREAKSLLKEIGKTSRNIEKERKKEEKRLQRQAEAAPAAGPPAGGMEQTLILDQKAPRRVPWAAIWIGAAVLILGAAAAAGYFLYQRQAPPPVDNLPALLAEAKTGIDQRQYDRAIEILQGILNDSPGHPEAQAMLDQAAQLKRQMTIDLLLVEAQNYRAQGQIEEGRQALQKILDMDPANEPARAVLSQIEAELSASKSTEEQDVEIKKWAAAAVTLIRAGKVSEAKSEIDKIEQLRPTAPELGPLKRQLAARTAELAKMQREQQEAGERAARIAGLSKKAQDLYRQGKYQEAQSAVDQWLSEDAQSTEAQSLRGLASEASVALRAFEAAMTAGAYDDALAAVGRLERANASDPRIAESRKRAETRKASAVAYISVFRLAEPGSLSLDGQPLGDNGEVENRKIAAGSHKLEVELAAGKAHSVQRSFADGANIAFVYDANGLRIMVNADRELITRRKAQEQVFRYKVEHSHGIFRGKCDGELRISGLMVEYQGSDRSHSFSIPFRSMKLSVKDERLEFTDVHNLKYNFKLENVKVAKEFKDHWDNFTRLARP